jgi:microcompartment protein CcmK/EutM
MELARVRGTVVASIKAGGLSSHKLLVLEQVSATAPQRESGETFVAIDFAGAGVGEVVLVTRGSAARIEAEGQRVPTDAAVIAIVDTVAIDGQLTFQKR